MSKIRVWEFVPLKSIGPVIFGMSREKVRRILGNYEEFRKSRFSRNTTDDFSFCHVYYDTANQVNAVEFFGNEIEILFDGLKIFPADVSVFKDSDKDYEFFSDEEGYYTSCIISVGIYAPYGDIESILFGKEAYYK